MNENEIVDKLFREMIESSKGLFDITARIDERTKSIADKQNEFERNVKDTLQEIRRLDNRVVMLESKNVEKIIQEIQHNQDTQEAVLQPILNDVSEIKRRVTSIELSSSNMKSKALQYAEGFFKIMIGIGVTYMLWKMGVK